MATIKIDVPKKLPLFLYKDDILLPGTSKRFLVTTQKNKIIVNKRLNQNNKIKFVGVIPSLEKGSIGTIAYLLKQSDFEFVYFGGLCRFKIVSLIMEDPYPIAVVTQEGPFFFDEIEELEPNLLTLGEEVRDTALSIIPQIMYPNATALKVIGTAPIHSLPDVCLSFLPLSLEEKLSLLNTLDIEDRLNYALPILTRNKKAITALKNKISGSKIYVNELLPKSREIKKLDNKNSDLLELEQKLKDVKLPPDVQKVVDKELANLARYGPFSPDQGALHSYLELIADLPWNLQASETLDIRKARQDLDVEHFGLTKLKGRILEYLAVRQLRKETNAEYQSTVLCLVGPPGVGKTSVVKSIAATLNRPFVRISLGGISNHAEIRGHRRTYVGAMPGRIIQALRQCKVNNPVILLDEIDKMVTSIHGSPSAALLEVLDPAQNNTFMDHYVNVPFDLSKVMFVATANTTNTLSPALKDRLEFIEVTGYTHEEKLEIALQHLLPKQLKDNGLNQEQILIPAETIQLLVTSYTREAGVRALERKIAALCRAVAVQIAEKPEQELIVPFTVDVDKAKDILGPIMWEGNNYKDRLGHSGVAVGMVWTAAGGFTQVVEGSYMPGNGKLILTGQLGNVLKESVGLAWAWLRSMAPMYGLPLDGVKQREIDVHIHFPEGAVSKEGPSAGVTAACVLVSLFLDKPVSQDVAMTGEITLQGLVLPVGGVKEKVLAAHRDGFTKIILPKGNEKNLCDIPQNIKSDLQFVLVSNMHEVLQAAFEGGVPMLSMSQHIPSKL